MPEYMVNSFLKDTTFDGYLLVRASERRTASNGTAYLDMTLCDRTGEINAKLWDSAALPPAVGTAVRVRGQLHEYNGRLQMRVDRIRPATQQDDVPMEMLVPCAPESPDAMRQQVYGTAHTIEHDGLRALVLMLLDDAGDTLLFFPAASKVHHAERSGLLHHMTTILRVAEAFCTVYPTLQRDLLMAGVIAHDLAKLVELNANDLGLVSDYSLDGMLVGHLVRGVSHIEAAAIKVGCDDETRILLEHMILSHHGVPEYGSPKPPMIPEAEVLHHLDTLDARIFEMNAVLARVRPGAFSERLWSLERKLYRSVLFPPREQTDA